MSRSWWVTICASSALFAGCPDDKTPVPEDVIEVLPDGQQCEPGAVVACVEEGSPNARFCGADGVTTFVETCPGENPQCRRDTCVDFEPGQICFPGEVEACVVEGGKEAPKRVVVKRKRNQLFLGGLQPNHSIGVGSDVRFDVYIC